MTPAMRMQPSVEQPQPVAQRSQAVGIAYASSPSDDNELQFAVDE